MSHQYELAQGLQSSLRVGQPNALLTTLIGNKGGGKNTLSTLCVQISREEAPKIPCFSNTHITGAYFVPDILKFLATKYVQNDFSPLEVDIDEAALAGLESRGSFKKERALDSYLFTLARKVNANIRLLSQLLSMIEKRTQWISDYYVLCEAVYGQDPDLPDKFQYKVFDTNLVPVNRMEVYGWEAAQYLFPRFRTQEIPFQEQFAHDLIGYYGITEEDRGAFDEIMGIKREEPPGKRLPLIKHIDIPRAIRPDEIVTWDKKRWVILDRTFNANTMRYEYSLEELIE